MTVGEFKKWCEDNNISDGAKMLLSDLDEMESLDQHWSEIDEDSPKCNAIPYKEKTGDVLFS